MGNKFWFWLAVFCATCASAQDISPDDKVIYLDSLYRETSKTDHVYLRVIKNFSVEADRYRVLDYYKSGKIKSESEASRKDNFKCIGPVITYYENGNKESEYFIDDDFTRKGLSLWYETGSPKIVMEFFSSDEKNNYDQPYKIMQFWDENGKQQITDGNGHFKDGERFIEEGNIVNGLKDGVWTGKSSDSQYSFIDNYKAGNFISGTSKDANGKQYQYTEIEEKPRPKKGLTHFYEFVKKKIRMPNRVLQGKIVLAFVIDKDGDVTDLEVLRSVDPELDQEAIRVVKSYPDWVPGKQRGQFVRVKYSLPITIATK